MVVAKPRSPFHRDRENRIDPTGTSTDRLNRRTGSDPSEFRTAGQGSHRGDADPAAGRGCGTVVGVDGSAASRAALRWAAAHRVEPTDPRSARSRSGTSRAGSTARC